MSGEKAGCATVSPHSNVLSYVYKLNVARYSGSCTPASGISVIGITVVESNPDEGLLTQQTFCFSPDVQQKKKRMVAFSSLARILVKMFGHSFPACTSSSFFFFKEEISPGTLTPLFTPGSVHSSSAS